MYNYNNKPVAVYLKTSQGICHWFTSYEEMIKWLAKYYQGWEIGRFLIGNKHHEKVWKFGSTTGYTDIFYKYTAHNEYCEQFNPETIQDDVYNYRIIRTKRYRYYRFKFRKGPVEGISCWRGGGHWHRQIKTTQERRYYCETYEDKEYRELYNIKTRRKKLPNAWDDINHTDWKYKNWKYYRKTQWKGK